MITSLSESNLLLSSLDLGTVTERHRILKKFNKLLEELKLFKAPDQEVNNVIILVIGRLKEEIENE